MTFEMKLARAAVLALGVGALAAGNVACARAQAKGAAAGPPLDVPAPPARVLAPVEEPVTASAPPPETPPPTAATAPRTPPPRPPARRTEPEKPETPVPAAATTGTPVQEPPRELRPASPAAEAAAEREAPDALARAARDLSRVDYGKLNAEARAQYDQSKRFMEQAQQALRDRNFVFASTLADKAAALAAQLSGR
jgi:hypothetical protein